MDRPIPRDPIFYNTIKEDISNKYKHSAYRSGLIVKKFKDEYYKKYNKYDAYIGTKPKMSNLERWFAENWTTSDKYIGYKKIDDIYRPSIRINKDTPTTFSKLTKEQIAKAKKEKALTGRVKKFDV